MKNRIVLFIFSILLLGCTKEQRRDNNPYIPNYAFSLVINENLPLYSGLKTAVNPIFINQANVGFRGIFIIKIGQGDYRAWEAACPNQAPSECSTMVLEGATNAKCKCDNVTYSLFTGVGSGQYPMKAYRVEVLDEQSIRVYN